jgi:hypothetical protein
VGGRTKRRGGSWIEAWKHLFVLTFCFFFVKKKESKRKSGQEMLSTKLKIPFYKEIATYRGLLLLKNFH